MSPKTTVGQVATEGGAFVKRPAGTLVHEPTSRLGWGARRGSLYVLVELFGPPDGRTEVANELAAAVRDGYFDRRGSTTAGLQQALLRANDVLLAENRNSLPGQRWTAGISAMALREGDLFVAQAGPAAAFLVRGGQVTRFPSASPGLGLAPAQGLDSASLGEQPDVHVDLFHAQVREGDLALLVHSHLAGRLSPQSWADVLSRGSVDDLLRSLVAAAAGDDVQALAVKLGGTGVQPVVIVSGPDEQAAPPQPVRGASPASAAQPVGTGEDRFLPKLGQVVLAALAALGGGFLTLLKRMVPDRVSPEMGEAAQPDPDEPAGQLPVPSKVSVPGQARAPVAQKLLTAVAIVMPLIVIAVVLYLVIQRGQAQRAEIDALRQSAGQNWQLAEGADATLARAHLNEAEQTLDELLLRQPDNADAQDLRGRVRARLDEINQVRRITWVAGLKTYLADADLSRVVVQGVNVFVMDKNSGRVYHHQLDEFQQVLEPATVDNVLLSRGDLVGDVLVGDLVDMVWMPTGGGRQKASLVILESEGSLLEYDPTTQELVSLKVAATETWEFPKLVGSYFGRFYVLDTTAGSILRYQPTRDGYSSPPDGWLQGEADLAGVIDMAIGDSIYLLNRDGQFRKFSAGEPDLFDISDWDSPPDGPGALFTRPPDEAKSVYVADRGNNRIVQSGKDGRFQRQFRIGDTLESEFGEALKGVSSLFVDEIGGRAYFLSGKTLYVMVLPD